MAVAVEMVSYTYSGMEPAGTTEVVDVEVREREEPEITLSLWMVVPLTKMGHVAGENRSVWMG